MSFQWAAGWDSHDNNDGATAAEIVEVLSTATKWGRGDQGLLEALSSQSDTITIVKGIHDKQKHITVDYSGGRWHVYLVQTSAGGRAGYRVGTVEQWRG